MPSLFYDMLRGLTLQQPRVPCFGPVCIPR